MSRIVWGNPSERYYQHGLDQGVLYIPGKDPVPWNGLTGFEEGTDSPSPTLMYRDGILYCADVDASDFGGKLSAMMFPDEFGHCLGAPKIADGLIIDNQKPQRFGFSYRTLVGSGAKGDMFGYQIHLVYNCMASIGSRTRRSIGKDTAPVEFNFDIVCTPVKLAGFRPTAHFVIDTRGMSSSIIKQLEDLLYGSAETAGTLPDPQELYNIMNFGDAMVFTVHPDGTYTVEGSSNNLIALDDYHFLMKNVNGVDLGDGTYTISDGGNTDVIIEAP